MTKRRPTGKTKARPTTKKTTGAAVDAAEADATGTTVVTETSAAIETPLEMAYDATPEAATSTAARRASRLNRQQAKSQALEVEYGYVVKDLRRVLLLAAFMVVALIAVNLAFTYLGG